MALERFRFFLNRLEKDFGSIQDKEDLYALRLTVRLPLIC
jgi:hypothetical protein